MHVVYWSVAYESIDLSGKVGSEPQGFEYRSGAKYRATLNIAPATISVLNDVFAWFIVPLIAVGHFHFITLMYWTV
jgi:hypothetical protein